jgi:hypothetical protein
MFVQVAMLMNLFCYLLLIVHLFSKCITNFCLLEYGNWMAKRKNNEEFRKNIIFDHQVETELCKNI